jgi:hypothetical protein
MLNVYNYHDNAKDLSLYDKLNNKFDLLIDPSKMNSSMDLEPILNIIIKKPKMAYFYAVKVLGHRFPEGEPAIMKDPECGYKYARDILKGRWEEAEPVIVKDSWSASQYAEDILSKDPKWTSIKGHENGRWPEAEPYIMKDPGSSYNYAKDVIKGRWREAEPAIMKYSWYWNDYARVFGI